LIRSHRDTCGRVFRPFFEIGEIERVSADTRVTRTGQNRYIAVDLAEDRR
jgi:hypothetical protein